MSCNYVYWDIESRSMVDIKLRDKYINDSTTQLMSGVWQVVKDGKLLPAIIWVNSDLCPFKEAMTSAFVTHYQPGVPDEVRKLATKKYTWVAHNAEFFDSPMLLRHAGIRVPKQVDTVHMARRLNIPGKLAQLCKLFGLESKGDQAAMLTLSKKAIVGTPYIWQRLIEYNVLDVKLLMTLHGKLLEQLQAEMQDGWDEDAVIQANWDINERGVRLNAKLLPRLKLCWLATQMVAASEISKLTNGKLNINNISNPNAVKEWLVEMDFYLPGNSLDKRMLSDIFANPEKYISRDDHTSCIAVLAERQNAVKNAVGKLDRMLLEMDDEDRVRRLLVNNGAGPGRYSSHVVQIHNLPRGVKMEKADMDAMADAATCSPSKLADICTAEGRTPLRASDVLSTMTRAVIIPDPGHKFVIFDYNAIEARCVAWLANCQTLTDLFATGQDVYKYMASKLFGVRVEDVNDDQRFVGKQVILACGYQMGAEKFAYTCKMFNIDLAAVGLTAEDCVKAYRATYPEIPTLWKAYNEAFINVVKWTEAGRSGEIQTGKVRFIADPVYDRVEISLPSQRRLRYNTPRMLERPNKFRPGTTVLCPTYVNRHGVVIDMYGGKITENIDQGTCSDILRLAILLDSKHMVMHCHDEGVWQYKSGDAKRMFEQLYTMLEKPIEWLPGMPLKVAGKIAEYYCK